MSKQFIVALIAIFIVFGGIYAIINLLPSDGEMTVVIPPSKMPPGTETPPAGAKQGNAVFAVTDAASSLENVESVIITVGELRVHSASRGWITVSENTKQFDLMKLKNSNVLALLSEAKLETGNYEQIRLMVTKTTVIEKTSGKTFDAKIPSGDLKLVGGLAIEEGKNSTVLFDFLLDKSLHVTGDGKYVFAPVIKLETKTEAEVKITDGLVEIKGGKIKTSTELGMNEEGEMKAGLSLDAKAALEIVGGAIRVKAKGENDSGISITAKAAIDATINEGHLDSAISVKMVTREGTKAWLVTGLKGIEITNVYINSSTGAVMLVE